MDASRARLFTFERTSDIDGAHEQLTEQRDLVNPARRKRPSELFSESRPGISRVGDRQFSVDDHRDAHIEELDAAFSRDIVTELETLVANEAPQHLIMCASPHMLGSLRDAGAGLRRPSLSIEEVPRDLVKLTPAELRDQLAGYGLLPPRPERPARPS